eukprot:UN22790
MFLIILSKALKADKSVALADRLLVLIYMFIGFSLPIQFGGFRIYDYFFLLSVAFLYSEGGNISEEDTILAE